MHILLWWFNCKQVVKWIYMYTAMCADILQLSVSRTALMSWEDNRRTIGLHQTEKQKSEIYWTNELWSRKKAAMLFFTDYVQWAHQRKKLLQSTFLWCVTCMCLGVDGLMKQICSMRWASEGWQNSLKDYFCVNFPLVPNWKLLLLYYYFCQLLFTNYYSIMSSVWNYSSRQTCYC